MANNKLEMNKYGQMLTDRHDGKKALSEILNLQVKPHILDFAGVISLGSSFGDEVIPSIAKIHNNCIDIINANNAVKSCLRKIAEDAAIEINFQS